MNVRRDDDTGLEIPSEFGFTFIVVTPLFIGDKTDPWETIIPFTRPTDSPSCRSDRNPFDFVECDLVAGAIVDLSRARAFMRGHGLSIL
jgi:hypothetical protein